jgi:hypothetical protein
MGDGACLWRSAGGSVYEESQGTINERSRCFGGDRGYPIGICLERTLLPVGWLSAPEQPAQQLGSPVELRLQAIALGFDLQ